MVNSSIKLKICGITQTDQALQIASLGATAIGVIGVKSSPRFISSTNRSSIFKSLANYFPSTERVLVVADMNDSDLEKAISQEGSPSVIQLHGNESKERCERIRKRYPNIKLWKALRIRTKEDLSLSSQYENVIDSLLLDAWSKHQLGGTGNKIPIEWLRNNKFKVPWWIAGGISAKSIPEIIHLNPFGIDASSKLEKSIGLKDINKVEELIKSINKIYFKKI